MPTKSSKRKEVAEFTDRSPTAVPKLEGPIVSVAIPKKKKS